MTDTATSQRSRRNQRAKMTPTLVRLPDDLLDELNRRAEDEDRSMAGLIRLALRRYLDAERPAPAATA